MQNLEVKRSSKNLRVGPLAKAVFIQEGSTEEISLGMLSEENISLKINREIMSDINPANGMTVAEFHMGSQVSVEFSIREVDLYNMHRVLMGSKMRIQYAAAPGSDAFTGNGTLKSFELSKGEVDASTLVVEIDAVATTAFVLVRGEAGGKDSIVFTAAPAADAEITADFESVEKKQLVVTEPSFENLLTARAGELKIYPADGTAPFILPRCVMNSQDGELQFGKEAKRSLKVMAKAIAGNGSDMIGTKNVLFKVGDAEVTADLVY